MAGVGVGEVEVLDLGGGVEGEALVPGPVEGPAQGVAGTALEGGAVEVEEVAEDAGHGDVVGMPGQELEGLRIGPGQDVGLLDPAEAVDGRAVEGHALLEGVLELGRRDAEGLGRPQDVGEPELDEADGPLLDRPEDVLLLASHSASARGRGGEIVAAVLGLNRADRDAAWSVQCRRRRMGVRARLHAVHSGATGPKRARGTLSPGVDGPGALAGGRICEWGEPATTMGPGRCPGTGRWMWPGVSPGHARRQRERQEQRTRTTTKEDPWRSGTRPRCFAW